jgi:hypothetical protein
MRQQPRGGNVPSLSASGFKCCGSFLSTRNTPLGGADHLDWKQSAVGQFCPWLSGEQGIQLRPRLRERRRRPEPVRAPTDVETPKSTGRVPAPNPPITSAAETMLPDAADVTAAA